MIVIYHSIVAHYCFTLIPSIVLELEHLNHKKLTKKMLNSAHIQHVKFLFTLENVSCSKSKQTEG